MSEKRKTITWIFMATIVVLLAAVYLIYQSNPYYKISRFERLVNSGKLKDMSLEIYCDSAYVCFLSPHPDKETLMKICTESEATPNGAYHLIIPGATLKEYADLIGQIKVDTLEQIETEGIPYISIYYVFKYHGYKLIEVMMWEEYDITYIPDDAVEPLHKTTPIVIVNGIRVKENAGIYQAIVPFVDENMAASLSQASDEQA